MAVKAHFAAAGKHLMPLRTGPDGLDGDIAAGAAAALAKFLLLSEGTSPMPKMHRKVSLKGGSPSSSARVTCWLPSCLRSPGARCSSLHAWRCCHSSVLSPTCYAKASMCASKCWSKLTGNAFHGASTEAHWRKP